MRLVNTSIQIDAPASRVWEILTDFPRHPAWNPFIQFISGPLQAGGKLTVRIKPPGGKEMTFRPSVLVAQPEKELRWQGKLLVPGLFEGEHFFQMMQTQSGTRFDHGEKFSGMFVALMSAGSFDLIERGFMQMNEALKARAEQGAIDRMA
jgi:hypothetical protein